MNLKRFFQASLGSVIGALLAAIVAVIGLNPLTALKKSGILSDVLGEPLQRLSFDLTSAFRLTDTNNDLVLLYMDEDSHEQLHQSYSAPWNRSATHARLLDRLKAEGAKAAVFDVVFSEPSRNPAEDAEFARSIKSFGRVVLAADASRGRNGQRILTPPTDVLSEAAAAVGFDQMDVDPDLIVRKHVLYSPRADKFPELNEILPPLCWAAADLLRAPTVQDENEWGRAHWINYYCPPEYYLSASYYRALSTDRSGLEPGYFTNKIVFIGAKLQTGFSGQRKDEYPSPFSRWSDEKHQFMPGVAIQATMFLNLLRHDWLTRLPWKQEFSFALAVGVLSGVGLAQLRPFLAGIAGILGMIGIVMTNYVLVTRTQVWFAWLVIEVEIAAAMLWSIVFNSISLYVQKRLLHQSLAMYVSPARVKQIIKQPHILKPGAEKQELSILFSDIANFTSMSEGMDSDDLANFMNNYFESAVANCIHKTDGTVVKFIGDAIFAIWNAPESQPNHQELACRGALLLRNETSAFKGTTKGLEIRTRIGLHAGVANVGNFGSSTRIDYTAIGENINLASRMEGLNKYLGTDVVMTGDVQKTVGDIFTTRLLGNFKLKGFERSVAVFELVGLAEEAENSTIWRKAFGEALKQFQKGDISSAKVGFTRVLELRASDGPSRFYLRQLEELDRSELPEDWTGEIELKEK